MTTAQLCAFCKARTVAYPGALYCGASCTARAEAHEQPPGWTKLGRGNDWGVEYIAPADKVHDAGGFASAQRGLKFKDGDRVHVRWPDGSILSTAIVHKAYDTTVGDMGHVYPVHYELPGIEVEHHGVKAWLPLDSVELLLGEE